MDKQWKEYQKGDLISRDQTINTIKNVSIGYDMSPFVIDRRTDAEKYADWLEMNKVIFQSIVEKVPPVQAEDDWIPVSKDMPVEYDSVFTRFHGTDKWRDGMWLKSSAKVLVTVEFEDGTRLTETAKTIDGKWATENRIRKRKVIAWKKMPKEYKG